MCFSFNLCFGYRMLTVTLLISIDEVRFWLQRCLKIQNYDSNVIVSEYDNVHLRMDEFKTAHVSKANHLFPDRIVHHFKVLLKRKRQITVDKSLLRQRTERHREGRATKNISDRLPSPCPVNCVIGRKGSSFGSFLSGFDGVKF